jgi:uncharacterized membrane protein YvbJ
MSNIFRLTKKCTRCGLHYPKEDSECPHCTGLTDKQLWDIKKRHKDEMAWNKSLGQIFIYIAGLMLVILIIYFLGY